jgi:hypothetical protein
LINREAVVIPVAGPQFRWVQGAGHNTMEHHQPLSALPFVE